MGPTLLSSDKIAINSSEVQKLLTASSSSALALVRATESVYQEATLWEPETLWLSFERLGLEVSLVNRAKIQAAFTLIAVPSFYWDAVIFEKTVLTFSDVVPNPDALQEATPAQMAWGVEEAKRISARFKRPTFDWETEPKVYVATVLHRAGYALAPVQLAFAQEQLDKLNQGDSSLRTRVSERLGQLETLDLANHAFEETPEDVQLGFLAAVKLYVADKQRQLDAELKRLDS
jgi:hypothetical protein